MNATAPIVLRPFQETAIESVKGLLRARKRRILVCIPTGGGKTLTAGAIIRGAVVKQKRVLFVAHRKELIDQGVSTLFRLGVHQVGVIRAGDKRKNLALPIQVGSIQTLARRPVLSPAPDLIFIDEAHRANAASYQRHLYEAYPKAVVIGLSATPCRADGKPLAGSFDEIVPAAVYSELIAGGFIDAPLVYSTPMAADLSGVHTTGGDFNQEELEEAVNRGALIGNIVIEWQKRAESRRTVVFCVSVKHSQAVRGEFLAAGVVAEHLDGTTPEDERAAILARLEAGTTQVVTNCGILTEGWDCPPCKCLVVARPTKSLALWIQMAGRCLRPWGDVVPLILDHGGNVDRHGMPHADREWSLTGRPKLSEGQAPQKVCPECFAYIPAACGACPHCGNEQPKPAPKPPPEPVIVDLALRTLEGDGEQLAFFRKTHKVARERGWRAGAVMHRFRERFGVDPQPAWWDALKADYRRDAEWKAGVAERKAQHAEAFGAPVKEAS